LLLSLAFAWILWPFKRGSLGERAGHPVHASCETNVCFWHKADMLNALANGGFWGAKRTNIDQPLLTNLDL
jgi:hypothetical protein